MFTQRSQRQTQRGALPECLGVKQHHTASVHAMLRPACSRSPLPARAMTWTSARDIAIFQHLCRKKKPNTRTPLEDPTSWIGTSRKKLQLEQQLLRQTSQPRMDHLAERMNVCDPLCCLSHAETNTRWTFTASMEQSMTQKRNLLCSGLLDETTQDENHFVSLPIPDLTICSGPRCD